MTGLRNRRPQRPESKPWLAALLVITVATGCGGGDGIADGGTGGTGITAGVVTERASIQINEQTLSTEDAEVIVDGDDSATMDDIREGHVVRVEVDFDRMTALTVERDTAIRGPVQGPLDDRGDTQTLRIFGEEITIDDRTVVAVDGESLSPGDRVAVSAFHGSDGELIARRIEEAPPGPGLRTGPVRQRGATGEGRFRIGSLTVDYAGEVPSDEVDDALAENDFVRITGQERAGQPGHFDAQALERIVRIGGEPGDTVVLEGLLTVPGVMGEARLRGAVIEFDDAEFVGGDHNDLDDNRRVRVRGTLLEDRRIEAERIEIQP